MAHIHNGSAAEIPEQVKNHRTIARLAFELDGTDWALLSELQQHARMTIADAGRRIGLTAPATAERLRRLEEAGVIRGYHALLNLEKLGRPLTAFVRVRFSGSRHDVFQRTVERMPEILECYHITGEDCFIMKVAVATMHDLERVSSALSQFGSIATSVVYSTMLERRAITAPV